MERTKLVVMIGIVRETVESMRVDSTTWELKKGQLHALMYAAGQLIDWTDQAAYQWVDSVYQKKRLSIEITPRQEAIREADGDLIWA